MWQQAATSPHNIRRNFTECFNRNISLARLCTSSLRMVEEVLSVLYKMKELSMWRSCRTSVTDFFKFLIGKLKKSCAVQIVRRVDENKAWINITP